MQVPRISVRINNYIESLCDLTLIFNRHADVYRLTPGHPSRPSFDAGDSYIVPTHSYARIYMHSSTCIHQDLSFSIIFALRRQLR